MKRPVAGSQTEGSVVCCAVSASVPSWSSYSLSIRNCPFSITTSTGGRDVEAEAAVRPGSVPRSGRDALLAVGVIRDVAGLAS